MQTGDIIDEIVDFVLAILPGSNADVAQLVEQRFRKPQVTGSNPVVGSSPESFRNWMLSVGYSVYNCQKHVRISLARLDHCSNFE